MSATSAVASPRITPAHIAARVIASLVGGYALVWGFIAAAIPLLVAAGMAFADARNLTHLLAFLVYLFVACWAFVAAALWRVVLVLGGGGGVLTTLAWLLTRSNG